MLLSKLFFNNCNIEKLQRSDRSVIGLYCAYEFPHSAAVLVGLNSVEVVTYVQCEVNFLDERGDTRVEKSA